MPASYDDLCQRYESCVKNVQDSIYTLESFMGNNTAFTFNMAQSLGNLDELDITKEEKARRTPNKSIRGASKSTNHHNNSHQLLTKLY